MSRREHAGGPFRKLPGLAGGLSDAAVGRLGRRAGRRGRHRIGRRVFRIFDDFDRGEKGATAGGVVDHGAENIEQVPGHAFAGAVRHHVGFPEGASADLEERIAQRVFGAEDAGVVEVFVDPPLKEFQFPEIHDEAVLVGGVAAEGERDRPIVAVDERAMAVVAVLAVRPGNVRVGFLAGDHAGATGERRRAGDGGRCGMSRCEAGRRRWRRARGAAIKKKRRGGGADADRFLAGAPEVGRRAAGRRLAGRDEAG